MDWENIWTIGMNYTKSIQAYWKGMEDASRMFMAPIANAYSAFFDAESRKIFSTNPFNNAQDYLALIEFNQKLGQKIFWSSALSMAEFCSRNSVETILALNDTFREGNGALNKQAEKVAKVLHTAVYEFPEEIRNIKKEFGFHFDNGGYEKFAETERYDLWRVFPSDKNVRVREDGKPIIIAHPYVLGANILAFLPGENKSYVHAFANQGIPTYIRVMKDASTHVPVQVMTGEDDVLDMRYFCERVKDRHGKKVTLNGFCQGGYFTTLALLSGELDGLTDAHITCVTPFDGSIREQSLTEYMMGLPPRFRDIAYSLKTLPNGNKVIDGRILGWVYKLKSLEIESPIPAFHRNLSLFDGNGRGISKTAAAINHWLAYDQIDLPVEITRLSFKSYSTPISPNGDLPVTLFGRKLNLKRINDMNIKWLFCIADKDDLVGKKAALAPLQYIHPELTEVTIFPKGHASIATSETDPRSKCSVYNTFKGPNGKECRGPVCFQLCLDECYNIAA